MKKFLFALLLVSVAVWLPAQTNISAQVQELLPTGKCEIDQMELSYSPRFIELANKMQTTVSANKEWWLSYVKQYANSGKPLPYNSKLGLTEEEYAEYLSLGKKQTLAKVQSCELSVKVNSDIYEFDGGANLPELTGLKINLQELTVATPFGILKNPEPDESAGGGALGAFSGYRWHFEEGDIDKGDITTATFLIGKLKASGRSFIYYKGSAAKANNPISRVDTVIYYDKS